MLAEALEANWQLSELADGLIEDNALLREQVARLAERDAERDAELAAHSCRRPCDCRVAATVMAPGPPKTIGKGLFTQGFTVMLLTERFAAGRSMNSLVTGLGRQGAEISPATGGLQSLRYGWNDVGRQPCATAVQVARVLRLRGWDGRTQPCSRSVCPPERALAAARGKELHRCY